MSFRIKFVQLLLDALESILFYPKLAAYYRHEVKKDDLVIFDVGANDGQSIAFFLKLFPRAKIFAFEPNYQLFGKLQERFQGFSNVILVNKGVSNRSGKMLLKETVTDETSTFEELNYDSPYLKKKAAILGLSPESLVVAQYEVEVISLAEFIHEQGIRELHVLKIDIEGHEIKCLEGLFAGGPVEVTVLQMEFHQDDMYLNGVSRQVLDDFLLQNGLRLHKRIKHSFGDLDELLFRSQNSLSTLHV